ncbi:MAG: SH3 domain-containing protein [Anaerolineae bacterium]|nr:SH3 domain-containing protein [Anaerolineae bacterium]
MRRFWFTGGLLLAALLAGISLAQDTPAATCQLPAPELLAQAADLCQGTAPGAACIGAGTVAVDAAATEPGTLIDLASRQTLTLEQDGLVLLRSTFGLADENAAVTLIAYGAMTLENTTQSVSLPLPTLTLRNPGVYVLNLRDQPDKNSLLVGTLDVGIELTADGRTADNRWLHVQTDAGAAWISTSIVEIVSGSINDLAVLDSHYVQPWQRLRLQSSAGCGGLLIQSAAETPARLQVNGADLLLRTGTVIAEAQPEAALQLRVLSGEVQVRAARYSALARQSDAVSVALGGADALTATAEPRVAQQYAFSSIAAAPLGLLPAASAICVAGVDGTAGADLYNGPGAPYSPVAAASPDYTYVVTGQNTSDDGATWWRLADRQWVAQASIATAGLCSAVVEVPRPTLVTLAGSSQSVVHNFLPAGTSVWQASTGEDTLSGTCNTPPIAQCSHLVAIIPDGRGGLGWRGQEPQPYPMSPIGNDTFAFSGRNQLGNARLSLSIGFSSDTSWGGQMTLVYDNDPGCTHTFYYTASRVR